LPSRIKSRISPIGKRNLLTFAWPPWNISAGNTTNGDTVLNRDFREFVESLKANDVRYLVVGAFALAVHGHPRYTKDLDVWIERTPENARRLIQALEQFGFLLENLKVEDFLQLDQVIQLGFPPVRIDLLTSLTGLEFPLCHENRLEVDLDGLKVDFIGLEDLKKSKQAAGRLQDLADLERLR
jgi:predicted nucleotidyltransferase